jgi:Xaa-Pro aminopeptidase
MGLPSGNLEPVGFPMSRLRFLLIVLALLVPALAPLSGQLVPYGGAREYVQDLRARRTAVMDALGSGTALVLWSAPRRVYSTDTDYEYRQESNMLYLTGLEETDATLVLVPGASGPREFLFIRAKDPFYELWNGSVPSPEDVAARTGVAQVFPQRGTEAFDAFFHELSGREAASAPQGPHAAAAAGRAAAPVAGPFRLLMLEDPAAPATEPASVGQIAWAKAFAAGRSDTSLASASDVLDRVRRVKTPYEQGVMRRAAEITAGAHIEGMKVTRPGRWEYQVEAAIEHWFLSHGAMSWAYPSIVGSGSNATILHYTESTRQMQAGDLLLVDAGANFQGLAADVTRTWPVSGRFSPDQRVLYDIVLEALEAGAASARPGGSVQEVTRAVRAVIGRGLLRVGLVIDPEAATGRSAQIDLWFPHSPVHGIGIDVHESLRMLEPGVTFTIEPGIYVRPDTLGRLAQNPGQAELARALRPAVERFLHMGIRIEDTVLMTTGGLEVLSSKVPKQASEIEHLVGSGR